MGLLQDFNAGHVLMTFREFSVAVWLGLGNGRTWVGLRYLEKKEGPLRH